MWKKADAVWRFIEGLHTAAWLLALLPVSFVTLIGGLAGVPAYWLLVCAVLMTCAILLVADAYLPGFGRIPLERGALYAFKKLHGTSWVSLALQHKSHEQRLDAMASYLMERANVYGRRPPAQYQLVSQAARAAGHIRGGGRNLHMEGNPSPSLEALMIDRSELVRAIRTMKRQDNTP